MVMGGGITLQAGVGLRCTKGFICICRGGNISTPAAVKYRDDILSLGRSSNHEIMDLVTLTKRVWYSRELIAIV